MQRLQRSVPVSGFAMAMRSAVIVFLLAAVVSSGAEPPPSAGESVLRRSTIDGGGGSSSSPSFTVRGTLGQSDAAESSNGPFVVRGGFWVRSGPSDRLFGSGFE
ncbi:MAG: hypothetical protein ACNS61_06550 [Candidatus Wenzhouxiangella sp. M2_3B_020]